MSIVLDDTKRMQELPEDIDQPPADTGNEYLVFYLTVTEIENVFITDMLGSRSNPPMVVAGAGKEYPAIYARIDGIKFLDPTNLTGPSILVEGSDCIYAFEVPKGSHPSRLMLSYKYLEEIEDEDAQSIQIKIKLAESDTSKAMKTCQVDRGQNEILRFEMPFNSKAITIDGKISQDEWDDAFCIDLRHYKWGDFQNGEMLQARWRLQYDQQFIYYLVRVSKEIQIKGTAAAYFRPRYDDGTWPHSDGFFVDTSGFYQDYSNWDETNWHKDETLSPPGNIDGAASVSEDSELYWFEIKKTLVSVDGYDWALGSGQVIGNHPKDSFLLVVIEDSDYFRSIQMELEDR
jgi:hypothetical protein